MSFQVRKAIETMNFKTNTIQDTALLSKYLAHSTATGDQYYNFGQVDEALRGRELLQSTVTRADRLVESDDNEV